MIITLTTVNARKFPSTKTGHPIRTLPRWTRLVNTPTPLEYADGIVWAEVSDPQSTARSFWVAVETPDQPLCYQYEGNLESFQKGMIFILGQEGGVSDDPHDKGGYTKYGIAQKFHPDIDVRSLDVARAEQIYYRDYWLTAACDKLPWPINVAHFDAAVNMGVGTADQLLRVTDGFSSLLAARRFYYEGLIQFRRYGAGWLRRVEDLAQFALELN